MAHSPTRQLASFVMLVALAVTAFPIGAQDAPLEAEPVGPVREGATVTTNSAVIKLTMTRPQFATGGAGFAGLIRDAHLQPLPGAYLELRALEGGVLREGAFAPEPVAHALSDEDGTYHFGPLPAGTWVLNVVGSHEPRSIDEFGDCALALFSSQRPPGVAVSRFLVEVPEVGWRSMTFNRDFGVPLGVAATLDDPSPLGFRGRLSGAFDPEGDACAISLPARRSAPAPHSDDGPQQNTGAHFSSVSFGALPYEDGSFDFGGMPLETYGSINIDIHRPGYVNRHSAHFELADITLHRQPLLHGDVGPEGRVAIELPELREVQLRVTGRPVTPVLQELIATATEQRRLGSTRTAYLHEAGDVIEMLVAIGRYDFEVTSGERRAFLDDVEIEAGAGPVELLLELAPSPAIEFRVVDRAGRPVDGAVLMLDVDSRGMVRSDGGMHRTGFAMITDGQARLEHVAPGVYTGMIGYQNSPMIPITIVLAADMEPFVVDL